MSIQWSGHTGQDHNRGTYLRVAAVDGKRTPIHVSEEAIEDYGAASCWSAAMRKLKAAVGAGRLPEEILVTTADFER
jgi:hypothetical protein